MARQPNGRAAINKRADGLYHTEVTIGTKPNGEPKRKHIKRKTATAVKQAVKELEARLEKGHDVEAKIDTFGEWMQHWLQNIILTRVRSGKLAHGTWVDYRKMARNHLVPALGKWRLVGRKKRLEPEHVEELYATMAEKGLAPSYIYKAHVVLQAALSVAYKRGKADRNVADLVEEPESEQAEVDPLSLADVKAVLATALDDELAARWILGIIQGPRQGEVLGYRWPQLELDPDDPDGLPHIKPGKQWHRQAWEHGCGDPIACARPHCRTKKCAPRYLHGCADRAQCPRKLAHACPQRYRDPERECNRHLAKECPPVCEPGCDRHALHCPSRWGGGLVEARLKTRKSAEPVYLAGITVELLRRHREQQIKTFAAKGWKWDDQGPVFVDANGKQMDPRQDHQNWKTLQERAGIKRRHRLHAARHTTGTYLRATGSDLKEIMDVLRQAKVETAARYVKVASEAQRDAVERVAAALIEGDFSAILKGAKKGAL